MHLKRKGIFIVLSSPSGGGKTSIYKAILTRLENITYSVSYTTRQPREGEIQGKDYYFVERNDFEKMKNQNQFVEWAVVHGAYYGTHLQTLQKTLDSGQDILLDIDIQGAQQLSSRMKEGVFIFIFPPSMTELERRLRERGSDTDQTIRGRLEIARAEMEQFVQYDYLIINDSLDQAIADVRAIIEAERLKICRYEYKDISALYHKI